MSLEEVKFTAACTLFTAITIYLQSAGLSRAAEHLAVLLRIAGMRRLHLSQPFFGPDTTGVSIEKRILLRESVLVGIGIRLAKI